MSQSSPRAAGTDLRAAAQAAYRFALFFAGASFVRAAAGIAFGKLPVRWIMEGPVITLGIFFTGTFVLQVVGAVSRNPDNHLQLDVNPWFAWLLCGGLVVFFIGLLSSGHEEGGVALRRGGISTVVWAGLIAIAWLGGKLFVRRGV
jgi:hypothetical protein